MEDHLFRLCYFWFHQKQIEYHKLILTEIRGAEDLIDSYLINAKPTYGQLEVVNMPSEIRHIVKITMPYANGKAAEIHFNETNEGAKIVVDRRKFQQALVNIIRNGIEAMTTVVVLVIKIKATLTKACIRLIDEGDDMTKEELGRLGEPYFSSKTKGTGIGMMVTYSIVRQMNGEIFVESEKGKGTEFIVEFPTFAVTETK